MDAATERRLRAFYAPHDAMLWALLLSGNVTILPAEASDALSSESELEAPNWW